MQPFIPQADLDFHPENPLDGIRLCKMSSEDSMEIIVAGLPRTGTVSLKAALEQLGFGPCHHLLEPPFQITRLRRSAAAVQTTDPHQRAKAFRELYSGYKVALDLPGTACVDELVHIYPQAKVRDQLCVR